jgi:O-acetyl-ADP-ribose deacetylase (regulator of RNase III)
MVKINVMLGDITKVKSDIIVNAANKELWKGGGVCGAIHKAAGVELQKACDAIIDEMMDEVPTGEVQITEGFKLPCKYVIHAVGPVCKGETPTLSERALLACAYTNALDVAESMNVKSISFPCISTGTYGFPQDMAAAVVMDVLNSYDFNSLKTVNLVCFLQEDYDLYEELLNG